MGYIQDINLANLKIARENKGLSTVLVSKLLTTTENDIVSLYESGKLEPKFTHLKKLAKKYGISELLFFTKEQLQRIKTVPDYRVGQNKENDVKIYDLVYLFNKRQKWLENELRNDKLSKNLLQGAGRKYANPEELAHFIKESLEIKLEEVSSWYGNSSRRKLLKYLISKAEKKGVFVGKTLAHQTIEVKDMRGVFLSNDYCPYIIINRGDAISGQIFSFAHELAHLFRKTDSISNTIDFRAVNKRIDPEEVFCNRVAAELLLPRKDFTASFYSKSDIDRFSEIYKVSKIFIFYRLKDLRKIPREEVDALEQEIKRETQRNIELKEAGKVNGGNFNTNMKDSNGDLFNKVVYSTFLENRIGRIEASNLLCFSVEMA
jgi:Zn-dependent peptidase ImmA (M78 family)